MPTRFTSKFDDKELAKTIKKMAKDRAEKAIDLVVNEMKEPLRVMFELSIKQQPEYDSLKNGALRYHFGLGQEQIPEVDNIINLIVQQLVIKKTEPKSPNTLARVEVIFYTNAFLSGLAETAGYISVSERAQSFIRWLKWLLYEGDNIIIDGYEIRIDEKRNFSGSRTSHAIMVQRDYVGKSRYNESKGRRPPGNEWRVPPEFSGTQEDNWITRAVNAIIPQAQNQLNDKLARIFA